MNLNVGCGNMRFENCINLDLTVCSMTDVDIQADILRLPFKKESFDSVFIFQVIEHIERKYLDLLFQSIWRVLKENGRIMVTNPDGIEILKRFIENTFGKRWEYYHPMIFGRNLYLGDRHHCLIEKNDLIDKLFNAGFVDVKCNIDGVDMVTIAKKGEKLPRGRQWLEKKRSI